jgi:hypothetical protein
MMMRKSLRKIGLIVMVSFFLNILSIFPLSQNLIFGAELRIPKNAELDFTGSRWKCSRGYRLNRERNGCVGVGIPKNAELDFTGSRWKCSRGYRLNRERNGCVGVGIPQNAELDFTGSRWKCSRGYRLNRERNGCVGVGIPQNAELDFTGSRWKCSRGFKLTSNRNACTKMTRSEIIEQQKRIQKIMELMKKRRGYGGISGGSCDDAYNGCVSECSSTIFNHETGDYVTSSDAQSKCEDSCSSGRSSCESEDDKDSKCSEFKSSCESECPSSIFNYTTGEYLMLTDVNSKCEDACSAGESACG